MPKEPKTDDEIQAYHDARTRIKIADFEKKERDPKDEEIIENFLMSHGAEEIGEDVD